MGEGGQKVLTLNIRYVSLGDIMYSIMSTVNMIFLKDAKSIDLKSSHHKKKNV